MRITGSKFEGNIAYGDGGNNIENFSFEGSPVAVICNDGTNTFESSDVTQYTDSEGNFPAGLCAKQACDVRTFGELQGAIVYGDGDIKLCSGTIVFTEQILLHDSQLEFPCPNDACFQIDKQLTFTCPNGDCILDAESNSSFFLLLLETPISFNGITFKNGKASSLVSPQ